LESVQETGILEGVRATGQADSILPMVDARRIHADHACNIIEAETVLKSDLTSIATADKLTHLGQLYGCLELIAELAIVHHSLLIR